MMNKNVKKSFFLGALTALAGTLAFTGCGEEKQAAAQAAPQGPTEVPLTVETVAYQSRDIVQELPGRVDAVRLADVSARVT